MEVWAPTYNWFLGPHCTMSLEVKKSSPEIVDELNPYSKIMLFSKKNYLFNDRLGPPGAEPPSQISHGFLQKLRCLPGLQRSDDSNSKPQWQAGPNTQNQRLFLQKLGLFQLFWGWESLLGGSSLVSGDRMGPPMYKPWSE